MSDNRVTTLILAMVSDLNDQHNEMLKVLEAQNAAIVKLSESLVALQQLCVANKEGS